MGSLEEGHDGGVTYRTHPYRPMPLRVLQILLMFVIFGIGISVIFMYAMKFLSEDGSYYVAKAPTIINACFRDNKYKRLENMESWIRPPSILSHPLNDSELLWRASFMPRIKEYPFNRVPKIAFMFLSKGPLPLAPLWEKFFKGHEQYYSIYVHSHPAFRPNFTSSSTFYKRQIPSQVC